METMSTGELFRIFVAQNQYAVMMHLGKFVHPETGKVERNLEAAKFSIDILGMLEEKTKGNLDDEEARFLQQVLTTLRLNYIDEANRQDTSTPEDAPAEAGEADAEEKAADGGA